MEDNPLLIDLHSHSTNSDGTWSVLELLKTAQEKGIQGLAITDHDNFKGSQEAFSLRDGVYTGTLVPGIEISARIKIPKNYLELLAEDKVSPQKDSEIEEFEQILSIHILAYFPSIDIPESHPLLQALIKIRDSRVWRMKEMIKKVNSHPPFSELEKITFEDVLLEAGKGVDGMEAPVDVISRPHLGRVMVSKGYASSMDEVFDKYIADGKPIHVYRFSLELDEWVNLTHELGGLLIWAHPFQGPKDNLDYLRYVALKMKKAGIDGIERIYDYKGKYVVDESFIKEGTKVLETMFPREQYLITCGGDFHGDVGKFGELYLDASNWDRFLDQLGLD